MNKEVKEIKEVINTVVNQPIVDIINLINKFCVDNDNNKINSWSTENLIGKISQKCSEILVGVKKETDRLNKEIEQLNLTITYLTAEPKEDTPEKIKSDKSIKKCVSEETVNEVIKEVKKK